MKLYKITDKNDITYEVMKWGERITNSLSPCKHPKLCTSDVIHAYKDLNLAILLNPIHGHYEHFNLWAAEGEVVVEDWGKCGVFELTTTKRIQLPDWYRKKNSDVFVRFAVLCAREVLDICEKKYSDDRPRKAIEAAERWLEEKTYDVTYAADVAYAARTAVYVAVYAAARTAGNAAYAAGAAARAAADAADAVYATVYAARAAADAADSKKEIDFVKLAQEAVRGI